MRAPLLALVLGGCAWSGVFGGQPVVIGHQRAGSNEGVEPAVLVENVPFFVESTWNISLVEDPLRTAEMAAAFARDLANQAVKKKYDREPFQATDGDVVMEDHRWVWRARRGAGPNDITALVSFDVDGSLPSVGLGVTTSVWE